MREGDVIEAEVVDVKDNGLYLRHEGLPGFVNVTHLTWSATGPFLPSAHATPGEKVKVRVYAVSAERFYASLKDLHPEQDPWRDPSAYAVGTVHRGVVQKVVPFGALVLLDAGAIGLLEPEQGAPRLELGQELDVIVVSLDLALKKIGLRRAPVAAPAREAGHG